MSMAASGHDLPVPRVEPTADEPSAAAGIAVAERLPGRANSRHLPNLDEVLVRQWPARKLRKLAADLERSEIDPGETQPFDERRYLALCRCVVAGIEQHAPSAVSARISRQHICAKVIEVLHDAGSGHQISNHSARHAVTEIVLA